jgi:geranylgeranyl diphosphate synthase type II
VDFDLAPYLKTWQNRINAALNALVTPPGKPSHRLQEAMRYSLLAGGKRVRPILCLAAAEAIGADTRPILPTACAIEMIHTYSLIHDDLPAMDNDDFRRGMPTLHRAFDEATAILAGDALLTLAFEILAVDDSANRLPADQRIVIIHSLAQAAGAAGMIEGQMQDIQQEGQRLALEDLEALHRLKTGALIEAAVSAGAVLGGGSERQQVDLRSYARHLGLAFQVTDDILNVTGDPAVMGKATGTDATRQKNTYPALMGLPAAQQRAQTLIEKALKALVGFDTKANPLRSIARYVIERRN